MQESAWEPEEREYLLCEAIPEHHVPATWRRVGYVYPYDAAGWLAWWEKWEGQLHWACDAHKVEPQPPEYAEWLEMQNAGGRK